MSYRKQFDTIKNLAPRPRGTAFESLMNKIFEDKKLLISKRYRTVDTQQEIDGAVLILNKVFLIETKWEDEDTLAASKLYSFLGKVNSKIEGTLGIFISYNTLKNNFIEAVRNGIKQNCIIIHGESNILDIIDEKVDLQEYLEYCYIKASTKNMVCVETSEFLSIPNPIIQKVKAPTTSNNWLEIYKYLQSESISLSDFTAKLTSLYSKDISLSKKILSIYNTINFTTSIQEKFKKIIEVLFSEEKELFKQLLIEKITGEQWKQYADDYFCNIIKSLKLSINQDDISRIINNIIITLDTGNWEDENKVSYILDMFFNYYQLEDKVLIAKSYIEIYCDDIHRKDKFKQKRFSNELFSDLKKLKGGNYFDSIKNEIINKISIYKLDEFNYRFPDDTINAEAEKKSTVKRVFRDFNKIFKDNDVEISFIEAEYDKL